MPRLSCLAVALFAPALVGAATPRPTSDPSLGATAGARFFAPDQVVWAEGPRSLPAGASMAVLEGDPTKEGPFVAWIKAPDGYRFPTHTRPKGERVTVLSGKLHVGVWDAGAKGSMRVLAQGAYGHFPAGLNRLAYAEGETVIQFHGEGPWVINYANPQDDPRPARERINIEFTADSLEVVAANIAEDRAVLVDVRSVEEWRQGHVAGSVLAPISSLQKHSLDPARLAEILPPKEDEKVLYTFCVVGMRAKQAAKVLQEQGYNVRALKPGYEQLLEAGFKKADENP